MGKSLYLSGSPSVGWEEYLTHRVLVETSGKQERSVSVWKVIRIAESVHEGSGL